MSIINAIDDIESEIMSKATVMTVSVFGLAMGLFLINANVNWKLICVVFFTFVIINDFVFIFDNAIFF